MNYKIKKINTTREEVFQKMKNLCAYQERSQEEIRKKIHEYGLNSEETDELIAKLIEENFLNEERFVNAFCSGKLKIKHWGRHKIKYELRKHKISEAMISKALNNIDENEYANILKKIILKKSSVHKKDSQHQFFSILRYCISKGYEQDLSVEKIKEILNLKTIN